MDEQVNAGRRQIVVGLTWWDGKTAEVRPRMPARVTYDDGVLVVESADGHEFYPTVGLRAWTVTTGKAA